MRKKSRKLRSVISSLVIFALITMMIPAGVFAEEAEAVPVEEVIVAEEVTEEAAPVAVEEEEAVVVTEEAAPVAVEEEAAVVAEEAAPVAVEEEEAVVLAGTVVKSFQGKTYKVITGNDLISYEDALAAVPEGYHLVCIDTREVQDFVANTLLKDVKGDYITGAVYNTNVPEWQWGYDKSPIYSGYQNFASKANVGNNALIRKSADKNVDGKWFAAAANYGVHGYIIETDELAPATSLKMNKEKVELSLGGSETLSYTNFPEGTVLPKDSKVVWSVEGPDAQYYTIDQNGVVTLDVRYTPTVGEITNAVARVYDKDNKALGIQGACALIQVVGLEKIEFKAPVVVKEVNALVDTTLKATPIPATDKTPITYVSSNPEIASVVRTTGELSVYHKTGEAVITATAGDKTASYVVKVVKAVETIEITKDEKVVEVDTVEVEKGQTVQFGTEITPPDATVGTEIVWGSSSPAVMTVDANGLVTGKALGEATLLVQAKNGETIVKSDSIKIKVVETTTPKPVATEYFGLNEYRIYDQVNISWDQAQANAAKMGGHLVTITSEEEQNAVAKLTAQASKEFYWMGGGMNKDASANTWFTGELMGYTNWSPGEPGQAVNDRMVVGKATNKWYDFAGTGKETVSYIVEIEDVVKPAGPSVAYRTHVEDFDWQAYVKEGEVSGTTGQYKRMEAFQIKLENAPEGLGLQYKTHIENAGWEKGFVQSPDISGTFGKALRLEALQLELTGKDAAKYDVYYQVHAQEFGWMPWAKNGEESGTAGYAYQLEGIRVVVVEKGEAPPAALPSVLPCKSFEEGPLAH